MPYSEPRSAPINLYLPRWPEELVKLVKEYSFLWDCECNILRARSEIFARMEMVVFSTHHKEFVVNRDLDQATCIITGLAVGRYKIFFHPDDDATDIQLGFLPEIRRAVHCHKLDFLGPALIYPDLKLFEDSEEME